MRSIPGNESKTRCQGRFEIAAKRRKKRKKRIKEEIGQPQPWIASKCRLAHPGLASEARPTVADPSNLKLPLFVPFAHFCGHFLDTPPLRPLSHPRLSAFIRG